MYVCVYVRVRMCVGGCVDLGGSVAAGAGPSDGHSLDAVLGDLEERLGRAPDECPLL